MKKSSIIACLVMMAVLAPIAVPQAEALSCLPVDMYLKDIVGKEEMVVFVGTATKHMEEAGYTAEVVTTKEALQGYVEKELIVYHQKDETWGYLCNNGPKEIGDEGMYIAMRDALGTYNVTQRLSLDDAAAKALVEDLAEAEITGEVVELTATDRMNQIITTITDLFGQITKLLKEYAYWKAQ